MKKLVATFLLLGLTAANVSALDYSALFSKVDPAVVVIATQEKNQRLTPQGIKQTRGRGLGSGVIVDAQGHILTAAHVVDTADRIMVMTRDGTKLEAEVVAAISAADLALIKLRAPPVDLPFVTPANSDTIEIGGMKLLLGGDIITNINGTTVSTTENGLKRIIDNYRKVQPGDKLSLTITRRGDNIELTATAQ